MDQVRIVIEGVSPQLDAGRYDIKAVVGDVIEVGADIWKDGHELLRAAVMWRKLGPGEHVALGEPRRPNLNRPGWRQAPLTTSFETNDRWSGQLLVDEVGAWGFTIVAWTDRFGSWLGELGKKVDAGQTVASELLEGMVIVEEALAHAQGSDRDELERLLTELRTAPDDVPRLRTARSERLSQLMERNDPRLDLRIYGVEIPIWVDRERARFGSWYEMFVRSQGTDPTRSATFAEAERRLPEIAGMGFDVLYLAPIHPIGLAHRKGPNNTEHADVGDPGSPWAIGSADGGHDAVHPDLGTIDDFDHFREAAEKVGLELALDFAVQCAPDHPWVTEHPEWFNQRPDGTIKYAENPPKKYQDIYPINFDSADRDGLYQALLDVVRFWIQHGIRIFRVDNPHTKPVSFWEWLIDTVHRDYPDVLFLAEAFTRPKRMAMLGKVGFTQSYTYFTWRTARGELEDYCNELFNGDARLYMRPNFFANTPDILHEILQISGRPAFLMRLVLAATLAPTYGIYSGFELCENTALREGSEEYLDSEKYQIRVRDWHAPGNIIEHLARINRLRREHRALQLDVGLRFVESTNPQIIAYVRATPDRQDAVLTVVNLDPFRAQDGMVRVPEDLLPEVPDERYAVTDLLTGERYHWRGASNYVRLDPHALPAHVLHLERK